MSKTVTTRRMIRPSTGVEQPQVQASRSEALQRVIRPTTLWGSWRARLADIEGRMSAALAADIGQARLRRTADLAEVRQLQARWLEPWDGLVETFEAAAAGASLHAELERDYRTYLGLRAGQLRALVRCALNPGEGALRQLDVAQDALDRFIAARRAGG